MVGFDNIDHLEALEISLYNYHTVGFIELTAFCDENDILIYL